MEKKTTFLIGCHLSTAKGLERMGKDALFAGASTMQFFIRNPRGASAKAWDAQDAGALKRLLEENGIGPIVAHAPYTMNPCSADSRVRELAGEMLAEDLRRMESFPGSFYNFHPGNRLKQPAKEAVGYITDMLNRTLRPDMSVTVLLETMAGKGSEMGRSFEELKQIMDRVLLPGKVGICMDSCHMWDAGYDIVHNLDEVLEEFDRIIGLEKLCAFHINDSLNPLGSRKDRHARIGEGAIGKEAVVRIINHEKLRGLPFILETPADLQGHAEEIAALKKERII